MRNNIPYCPACGRPMVWRGDRWGPGGTGRRRFIEGDWACVIVHDEPISRSDPTAASEPVAGSDPKEQSEPVAASDPIKRSEPVD